MNTVYIVDKEISADSLELNDLLGLKKPLERRIELNKEFSPTISAKVMNNSQVVHEDVSFNSVGGSGNNKGGSVLGVLDEMILWVGLMGILWLGSKSKKEWVNGVIYNNKHNFNWQSRNEDGEGAHMDVKYMEESPFTKRLCYVSDSFVAIYGTEIFTDFDGTWNGEAIFNGRAIPKCVPMLKTRISSRKQNQNIGAIEGDENSKYFHGIINKKRSNLAIRGVFVDGTWCTDPILVKKAFKDHYEARFNKPTKARLIPNFSFPNRLSTDQVADLERHVSHDEIRLAVWDCGVNKSPGPDGFTFEFFRKFWKVIGPDFCEAVEHFFKQGSFSKGCNSSFIALIPKVLDAKFVNDYRPISLSDNPIRVLLSEDRSWMVPFILNDAMLGVKGEKKKALFFKVDLQGLDTVRWDYSCYDVLDLLMLDILVVSCYPSVHGDKIDSHSVRKFPYGVDLKEVQFLERDMDSKFPLCLVVPSLFALDSAPNILWRLNAASWITGSSTSNDRSISSLSSSGNLCEKITRLLFDDLVLPHSF
ncbi:hypothetical protein Tco_0517638 [Tanacetum coccineum]